MIFFRLVHGYGLASLSAGLILLLAKSSAGSELTHTSDFAAGMWEEVAVLATLSVLVGAIMTFPTLIFLALASGVRGPSLLMCLLFGSLSGFLPSFILLKLEGGGNDAIAFFFGLAGLVASLVFWFFSVWPRTALVKVHVSPEGLS